MKAIGLKISIWVLIISVFAGCSSQKMASQSNEDFVALIKSQDFTFVARNVIPTEDSRYSPRLMFPNGSNLYQLTSRYDLRVTPDSVIAYLPFFGRAYTAPLNPNEGGIKFTSTKFSYNISKRKQVYDIKINPNDTREAQTLFLTVSSSGFASLTVSSYNRTPITYNGEIEANR